MLTPVFKKSSVNLQIRSFLLLILLVSSISSFSQELGVDTFVDFESGTSIPEPNYSGGLSLEGGTWMANNLSEESTQGNGGGLAIILNSTGSYIETPILNAPQTFSFFYAGLAGGEPAFNINVSVDGGAFNTVAGSPANLSTYEEYEVNLNETSQNVVVRIVHNGGTALTIDDISILFTAPANTNPELSINNILNVNTGGSGALKDNLLATDAEETAASLIYTITSIPAFGTLVYGEATLGPNDTFSQEEIDLNLIFYNHDGSESTEDSFTFDLSDGAGGELLEQIFYISINQNSSGYAFTSPAEGVVLSVNENLSISWTSPAADPQPNVTLALSKDGGTSFDYIIASGLSNTGSYSELIDPTNTYWSENAVLRITDDLELAEAYSPVFRLHPIAININSSTVSPGSNSTDFSFEYGTYDFGTFDIDYSVNNGQTWTSISTNNVGCSPQPCLIEWTVPDVAASNALLRVQDASLTWSKVSDPFMITGSSQSVIVEDFNTYSGTKTNTSIIGPFDFTHLTVNLTNAIVTDNVSEVYEGQGMAIKLPHSGDNNIQIDALSGVTSISFLYMNPTGGEGLLDVKISEDEGTSYSNLATQLGVTSNTFQTFTYNFTNPFTGILRLEQNISSGGEVVIDQLSITSDQQEDVTPPSFADLSVADLGENAVIISVTPTEFSTVYYLAVLSGATVPSVNNVVNPGSYGDEGNLVGSGSFSDISDAGDQITINNLSPGTTYDFYFVLEDAALNLSETVESLLSVSTSSTPVQTFFDFAEGISKSWSTLNAAWEDNPAYGKDGVAGDVRIAGGTDGNYLETGYMENVVSFSFYYRAEGIGTDGAAFEVLSTVDGVIFSQLDVVGTTETAYTQFSYSFTEPYSGLIRISSLIAGDVAVHIDDFEFVLGESGSTISIADLVANPFGTYIETTLSISENADLYYVITQSATAPLPENIMDGLDEIGDPAVNYFSYFELAAGNQYFDIGTAINGDSDVPLQENTTYYIHWLAVDPLDSRNQSEIATYGFTTLINAQISATTYQVEGYSLTAGSKDNLIYQMQFDVTTTDAKFEGFIMAPTGSFVESDFQAFNYYYSIGINEIGSATLLGSSSFFLDDPSGAPDGYIGYVLEQPIVITEGSTLYVFVTADMSTEVVDGGQFGLNFAAASFLEPSELIDAGITDSYLYDINAGSGTALIGNYTIGGEVPDFINFTEAIDALNTYGVSGPVAFSVRSGVYTEQLYFTEIPGASDTNIIYFSSETGSREDVVIQYTMTNSFSQDIGTINLDGADYIYFTSMTVESVGSVDYSTVIFFQNGADYNVFNDLAINMPAYTGGYLDYSSGISATYPTAGDWTDNSFNQIANCTINGGYIGIDWNGYAASTNSIYNNQIKGFYKYGILLRGSQFTNLLDNTIEYTGQQLDASPIGIYLTGDVSGANISGNKILNIHSGYGLKTEGFVYSSPIWIYNSFISSASGASGVKGVNLTATNARFIYNSIFMDSDGACLELNGPQNQVYNNAMVQAGSGNLIYLVEGVPSGSTLNYNGYYKTSATGWFRNSITEFDNLAAYQSSTGNEANSVSGQIDFVDNYDLHTNSSVLAQAAFSFKELSTDIDGNDRKLTPDIGADEFSAAVEGPEINVNGNEISIVSGATEPSVIDGTYFGSVKVGETITQTFVINNVGTSDLTITSIDASGDTAFEIVNPLQANVTITSGSSYSFDVKFTAFNDFTFSSEIQISSDDSDENFFTFMVSGAGVNPLITVLYPNGGELMYLDEFTEIAFDLQGFSASDPVTAEWSVDGGTTWNFIGITTFESTSGSFNWYLSSEVLGASANYLVRVRNADETISDVSDEPFEIVEKRNLTLENFELGLPSMPSNGDYFLSTGIWNLYNAKKSTSTVLGGGNVVHIVNDGNKSEIYTPLIDGKSKVKFSYVNEWVLGGPTNPPGTGSDTTINTLEIYASIDAGQTFKQVYRSGEIREISKTDSIQLNFNNPEVILKFKPAMEIGWDLYLDDISFIPVNPITSPIAYFSGLELSNTTINQATSDNLIYAFSVTASGGDLTAEGMVFTVFGDYFTSDFEGVAPFGLLVNTTEAVFETATFFSDAAFGDGVVVPTDAFGFAYTGTIPEGSTYYFFITADISATAGISNMFNIQKMSIDDFGILDPKEKVDNGLLDGPSITIGSNDLTNPEITSVNTVFNRKDGFEIDYTISEFSDLSYIIFESGAEVPTPEAIINAQLYGGLGTIITSGLEPNTVEGTIYVSGLLPGKSYDFYLVAVDPAGNVSIISSSQNVMTNPADPFSGTAEDFETGLPIENSTATVVADLATGTWIGSGIFSASNYTAGAITGNGGSGDALLILDQTNAFIQTPLISNITSFSLNIRAFSDNATTALLSVETSPDGEIWSTVNVIGNTTTTYEPFVHEIGEVFTGYVRFSYSGQEMAAIIDDFTVTVAKPPLFLNGTPSLLAAHEDFIQISVEVDKASTIYAIVVGDGAETPSTQNVVELKDALGNAPQAALLLSVDANTASTLSLTGLLAGTAYDVYIVGVDAFGTASDLPISLDVNTLDALIPSVVVNTPNGGESYTVGEIVNIDWTSANIDPADLIEISLSVDGGQTYSIIADGNFGMFGGILGWTVPNQIGTSNLIKVTNTTLSISDASDAAFQIAATAGPVITGPQSLDVAENLNIQQTYQADKTVTWSLSGTDAALFAISEFGELTFLALPDFETPLDADGKNTYDINIEANDGVAVPSLLAVVVNVTNVNDNSPVITTSADLSVDENSPSGTSVVTFEATDLDGDELTWTIISGNDDLNANLSSAFSLNPQTGELTLNDTGDLDYESLLYPAYVFQLVVEVTDGINTNTEEFNIAINDVSEGIIATIVEIPLTNNPSPTFSGTVDDVLADLTLTVNGLEFNPVNNNGTWAFNDNTINLLDGTYVVKITAVNGVKNGPASMTMVVDKTAPTVTFESVLSNQASPALIGTVTDAHGVSSVSVAINGKSYEAVVIDNNWSIAAGTIDPPLGDGTYDVSVSAVDLATNSDKQDFFNSVVIDLTAPAITVNNLGTTDTTPSLSGTVDDANAVVKVTVNGVEYVALVSGNNWTVEVTESLPVGTYDVIAEATDKAGNIGKDASVNELNITITTTVTDPIALAATQIGYFEFTANWQSNEGALSYQLDVALDKAFANLIPGFSNLVVNGTSQLVQGSSIEYGTAYYYRVRAVYPNENVTVSSNIITVFTAMDPATVADSLALLAIYDNNAGATWTGVNWKSGGKLKSWTGVTMTGTRITGLDLSAQKIAGSLPSIETGLAQLTTLNLSGNELTGLGNITQLGALTTLNISNNRLLFGDLEANLSVTNYTYSPQKEVLEAIETLEQQGTTYVFDRTVTGSANTYSWFRKDLSTGAITAITNTGGTYSLAINTFSNEGDYYVEVTNSKVAELTLTSTPITLKVSSRERDMAALLAIHTKMGGTNWTGGAANWSSSLALESWVGVTVANERVTELKLPSIDMTGDLPKDILDIRGLTVVDLSGNRIANVPTFTKLTNLTSLKLDGNNLHFDDLEPNMTVSGITYANQRTVGLLTRDTLRVGSSVVLNIAVGGSSNKYTWTRTNDVKTNEVVVNQAATGSYTIESLGYENMGTHVLTVTNDKVPGLTITSRRYILYATADLKFTALDQLGAQFTDGMGYALRLTPPGTPYDTIQAVKGSKLNDYYFRELILGDYLIAVKPNSLTTYLTTYYPNTDLWTVAEEFILRDDATEVLNMAKLPAPLPPLPDGGVVGGTIESEFEEDGDDNEGGRILSRKKVKRAACSMRRFVASGRLEAEGRWDLYAYVESDDEGKFTFTDIEAGLYRFNIEYPGIPMDSSSFVEFEIGADGKEQNTFKLEALITEDGIVVEKIEELGFVRKYFKDLETYPNPANDYLTVSYAKLLAKDVLMRVVDLQGRTVKQLYLESGYNKEVELDVSDIPDGIYLLNFVDTAETKKTVITKRIIVRHQ